MNVQNVLLLIVSIIAVLICLLITHVQSQIAPRIVGGNVAEIVQFPYQALLRRYEQPRCGGAIINIKYVLTAGHCVFPPSNTASIPAEELSVRVGSNQSRDSGVIVNVATVKIHPRYKYPHFDLALLHLETALQFSNSIRAIPITHNHVKAGRFVLVSGWGATQTGGSVEPTLRRIHLRVEPNSACYRNKPLNPTAFCTSSPVGKGICQGDSGGPAVNNGRLIGIVSFTRGPCGSALMDGFAKISFMRNWIKSNSIV